MTQAASLVYRSLDSARLDRIGVLKGPTRSRTDRVGPSRRPAPHKRLLASSCLVSSRRADEFDHFRVVVFFTSLTTFASSCLVSSQGASLTTFVSSCLLSSQRADEFDHFRVVVSLRESGDEFDHFRVVVSHPVSGAGGGAAKLPAGPVPR